MAKLPPEYDMDVVQSDRKDIYVASAAICYSHLRWAFVSPSRNGFDTHVALNGRDDTIVSQSARRTGRLGPGIATVTFHGFGRVVGGLGRPGLAGS